MPVLHRVLNISGNVVVTGAAGFIGGSLLRSLVASGFDPNRIVAVDKPLASGLKITNLAWPISRGVRFMDHATFIQNVSAADPQVIFHLGACSSTTVNDWSYLVTTNVQYTITLWRWCAENQRRLIYASSAATYGHGGFNDEWPIDDLRPLNNYGWSKQVIDRYVQNCVNGPRPRQSVGLKFFNVYGYGEAHKGSMASMVLHGFNQARSRRCISLFAGDDVTADGMHSRDFVYVDDVIRVILDFANRPDTSGLFNVGTGVKRTFVDLATAVFAAMNLTPDIRFIPMPADLAKQYQSTTQATVRKLENAGITVPSTPLETGVKLYVEKLLTDMSAQ